MKKQTLMAIAATLLFTCSASAQFVGLNPNNVAGVTAGNTSVNGIFDVSNVFGLSAGEVSLQVVNGFTNNAGNQFSVGQNQPTTFIFGGNSGAEVFVNHGANLGSTDTSGTGVPRDGVIAAAGESFSLSSGLEAGEYVFGSSSSPSANDFFVDYIGTGSGIQQNQIVNAAGNLAPQGFVFTSDSTVSSFTVFSTNTSADARDDGFGLGVQVVSAIPEPSSAMLIALGGLFALRRKRN